MATETQPPANLPPPKSRGKATVVKGIQKSKENHACAIQSKIDRRKGGMAVLMADRNSCSDPSDSLPDARLHLAALP